MQETIQRRPMHLDRLTLSLGAVLFAATVLAWFAVVRANAAMDDGEAPHVAEQPEMAVSERPMPVKADVRMRMGVSEQMSSWPWAVTFGVFLAVWIPMMAAMMFPAAAPMVRAFARSARSRYKPVQASLLIALFLTGYLAIWGGFGAGAFLLNELVSEASGQWGWVVNAGPYVGGGLLIGAGIYQFTWFKQFCLSKCRTPLAFMIKEWRDGSFGAAQMGAKHGLYCLGCCIGLMVGLIVAGVMSIGWMVTLAVLIFVEKVTRWGPQLARVTAVVMVVAGIALMVYQENLPGIV